MERRERRERGPRDAGREEFGTRSLRRQRARGSQVGDCAMFFACMKIALRAGWCT